MTPAGRLKATHAPSAEEAHPPPRVFLFLSTCQRRHEPCWGRITGQAGCALSTHTQRENHRWSAGPSGGSRPYVNGGKVHDSLKREGRKENQRRLRRRGVDWEVRTGFDSDAGLPRASPSVPAVPRPCSPYSEAGTLSAGFHVLLRPCLQSGGSKCKARELPDPVQ